MANGRMTNGSKLGELEFQEVGGEAELENDHVHALTPCLSLSIPASLSLSLPAVCVWMCLCLDVYFLSGCH